VTLRFELEATHGAARAGRIVTARGEIPTPVFMPVGTRGAVKTLDTGDLERLGLPILLANTYHLMERPGSEVIADLGGLHAMTGWGGHLLTDSGGYQIFSLTPTLSEEGATFASVYDGSRVHLSPERSVAIQEQLGADIVMVLDVCPPLPSPPEVVRSAMERSVRWAERCREARTRTDQAQFGIVQGGADPELRADSARRTVALDFEGYAVGGLSVGEGRGDMLPALEAAVSELPAGRPRYFMGLGDPTGIVEAVARGIDMMDCVLPTRLARHGTALTSQGRLNLKGARFLRDDGPIDPAFCPDLSGRYSRAYLRHLLTTHEPTGGRILTLHNVAWLTDLVRRAREAVVAGSFESFCADVRRVWG
jgi:queuine tRNA-ribosyltransferase